jgi:hypothetical protein
MAIGDYGFSGLYKRQNPSANNNYTINGFGALENLISVARVKSIVLDSSHPRFEELGGWKALGTIEIFSNNTSNIIRPLNPNIKNFPLINETVYVIDGLGIQGANGTFSVPNRYYITTLGIWNHPHHNAYPFNILPPPSQDKSYEQTEVGSPNQVSDQPTEIYLGKTFKERANIHPLLPFEGDIIYEGRWGNSIRLGSTVQNTANNWSSTGTDGDPIIIIRNGQGTQNDEGWIPVVENIDIDDTSIYLTSTQQIPLKAASTSYVSYTSNPPLSPNAYIGPQIILDSGRLVFNSYSDHILLSSAKSINLNSQESVNIDTKKFITQADQIFLGKEELANQPLMLGTNTVDLLKNLVDVVKELTSTLKTLQSAPVAPGSPATFPTLLVPMAKLESTLNTLNNQLNSGVLTSQRNFTL